MNRLKEITGGGTEFCALHRPKTFDRYDLSRMTSGRTNPTVPQAREIVEITGTPLFQIWEKADLDYTPICGKEKEERNHGNNPRITHRVDPETFIKVRDACRECGYDGIGGWLTSCVYRLLREAEHKKSRADAGTSDTGKGDK